MPLLISFHLKLKLLKSGYVAILYRYLNSAHFEASFFSSRRLFECDVIKKLLLMFQSNKSNFYKTSSERRESEMGSVCPLKTKAGLY